MKPIVVLSDIHGNLPAIESVYNYVVSHLGYDFDTIVLGDIIDYGSHSNECVDIVAEKFDPFILILGNHEDAIVGNGRSSRTSHGRLSYEYTKKSLGDDQRRYLKDNMVNLYQYNDILAFHGYLKDVWKSTTVDTKFSSDELNGSSIVLYGHTHLQSFVEGDGIKFVNPGSVGQPRNGDERAQFAIISDGDIELCRVGYDIDREASSIVKVGLPKFLSDRLYLGI